MHVVGLNFDIYN